MEATQKIKSLKKLVIFILAEMFLIAVFVWVFDPFYQYHVPAFGMDAVLNDRDNQMPGSIRNFQYDSVLVGSSVAENFDSEFLDEVYGCNTLKIIRASGSVADLLYYLEQAQDAQEIKNVFWCLDSFAMNASTEVTLQGESIPEYLHTESILDDLPYLYNKEILMEKTPYMLACEWQGINTGGQAYNWSRGKNFGTEQAMLAYGRDAISPDMIFEQKDYSQNAVLISENIRLLLNQIAAHPEIQYRFILPPYSMLWWDCAYVNGELAERFYILEQTIPALLAYENVEIYFFQNEASIVCNLDNYMDMIHYSPDINQYMLDKMKEGENRVTAENWENIMTGLRQLAEHISKEEIYQYYQSAE